MLLHTGLVRITVGAHAGTQATYKCLFQSRSACQPLCRWSTKQGKSTLFMLACAFQLYLLKKAQAHMYGVPVLCLVTQLH